jgi:hypothetical protein
MNRLLIMLAMVIACDIDEIADYVYDHTTYSDVLSVAVFCIAGLVIYSVKKANSGK